MTADTLEHHLSGKKDGGYSNFSIETTGKLLTVANYLESTEENATVVELLKNIVRAATLQRIVARKSSAETLNEYLRQNSKESSGFTDEDFATIVGIINDGREQWKEVMMPN